MNAQLLIKLLSDKHFFDLRRMQYKYSTAVVQELTDLLYHTNNALAEQLPICDFNSVPIVYLPSMAQISLSGATHLRATRYGDAPFDYIAMQEEIYSTLAIENISSSRDSIRSILHAQTPSNVAERRIWGMKQGFDFISDTENQINSENLHTLYQMTIGDFLSEDFQLLPDYLYRHDTVCVVGSRLKHQGLSAAKIPAHMNQLLEFITARDKMNDLHKASAIHFYLAYLHPYFDGNGRTSRLLHLWYLAQCGYAAALSSPLSHYIQKSKSAYYKAFSQIEENAIISGVLDITPFLRYFTNNVYNQLGTNFLA